MKIRRFIAILLMTLANSLILVHAVVPHYHHDGAVCFETEKDGCNTCKKNGHSAGCCKNEDKHHAHLEDCDLPDLVKRTDPSFDENQLSPNFVPADHFITICLSCLYDSFAVDWIVNSKSRHYIAQSESYISPYVASVYGLRAPPVI